MVRHICWKQFPYFQILLEYLLHFQVWEIWCLATFENRSLLIKSSLKTNEQGCNFPKRLPNLIFEELVFDLLEKYLDLYHSSTRHSAYTNCCEIFRYFCSVHLFHKTQLFNLDHLSSAGVFTNGPYYELIMTLMVLSWDRKFQFQLFKDSCCNYAGKTGFYGSDYLWLLKRLKGGNSNLTGH